MTYVISLVAGLTVGLLYWAFKVQSPAPPLIALTGLLGMVVGEHAIPIIKTHYFSVASSSKETVHPVHLMAKAKFKKDPARRQG